MRTIIVICFIILLACVCVWIVRKQGHKKNKKRNVHFNKTIHSVQFQSHDSPSLISHAREEKSLLSDNL